jgi:hypothetical protein
VNPAANDLNNIKSNQSTSKHAQTVTAEFVKRQYALRVHVQHKASIHTTQPLTSSSCLKMARLFEHVNAPGCISISGDFHL